MATALRLIRCGHPDDAALDTAVSHALLLRVDRGELPATLRVYRPGRVVAFGRRDTAAAGYPAAVAAAREHGFTAVERLAGGRAAVFHEGTIAFSWARPDADPRSGITARFDEWTALVAGALGRLGIAVQAGELAGEYCPGRHSVHLDGGGKVMGVGQRLTRGATHLGGVLVVSGAAAINRVLAPVYAALRLSFDPLATGALSDRAEVTPPGVVAALLEALSERYDLEEQALDPDTRALARSLVDAHTAPSVAGTDGSGGSPPVDEDVGDVVGQHRPGAGRSGGSAPDRPAGPPLRSRA